MSNYIFDNAGEPTGLRFSSLETLYDPWTIRHLEATGIGPGWQCWEVGAGGGSIAAWLAERCGSTGHVLVTDIDPRFLTESAALDKPTIEVQQHDIVTDPVPAQTCDLIHARLVLVHLPARELALQQMVTALKPGGWLVLEDYDVSLMDRESTTTDAPASTLYLKMHAAQDRFLEAHGGDLKWGRSLYLRLRAHGLVHVGMEGYVIICEGGSPGARLKQANFEQIRQEAVNAGFMTNEEVDQVLIQLDDPGFAISLHMLFTAWGRRP